MLVKETAAAIAGDRKAHSLTNDSIGSLSARTGMVPPGAQQAVTGAIRR